jgi:phosphocarrier protein HPr
MIQQKCKIINRLGLHARPAAEFVKLASKFKADIFVTKNDRMVNGKSIMGVMTLAAECGSELMIRANGEDEQQALEHLMKLIEEKFYEE